MSTGYQLLSQVRALAKTKPAQVGISLPRTPQLNGRSPQDILAFNTELKLFMDALVAQLSQGFAEATRQAEVAAADAGDSSDVDTTEAAANQVLSYFGSGPTANGVIPEDQTMPAIAVKPGGTIFVWDTINHVWDD